MPRLPHVWFFACGLLLSAILIGCGGERLSAKATAARRELQMNRAQNALDKLTAAPADDSAVAHYLKAVALERLDQLDAAKAEAQLAIERNGKNPKYQAIALRLKLFDGEATAIDPLLKLQDDHSSDPTIALFSVYALQAKMLRLRMEQKPRAARAHLNKASDNLKTALSLAADLPEFHHELIELAAWFEQPDVALTLVEAMLRDEPENPELLRSKIKVLVVAKQPSETIRTAVQLFRVLKRTELAALEFIQTLSQLPPSPAVIEQFAALRSQFPENSAVLLRHAWSLGKSGQSDEACEILAEAFDKQADARIKQLIAQAAIAIPLEANAMELAELQSRKFGRHVEDPQLLAYLEGRLALIRHDAETALTKLQSVIENARRESTASPALTREAARWLQRLLTEKTLTDQVRRAAELTLARSGLHRLDEDELRQEAQSLLDLLESHEQPRPKLQLDTKKDSEPAKPAPEKPAQ